MFGRLLGGTATSILYSAFESWLICEHNKVSQRFMLVAVYVDSVQVVALDRNKLILQ
jgi:hypothetical protein